MNYYKNTALIILLLLQQYLFSIDFKKIEEHVDNTPLSSTKSTIKLSKYLTEPFKQEEEKFAAIYFWVAKNIQYDVNQRNRNRKYFDTKELVDEVMKYKKGVCQHYSELFHELSNLAGLKSYVISGYGKEFGKVMNLAHAWNAMKVDNSWYLVDVTWGSGYLENSKYKKDFQLKYFMVKPDKFIIDHIPFDPMWQMLAFPITYDEFETGVKSKKRYEEFFYTDTIIKHFKLSEIEQKINIIRRVESNGKRNKLVLKELNHEYEYVEIAQKNINIRRLNSGNYSYNEAVKQINGYFDLIKRRNNGEKISDSRLLSKLNSIENKLDLAKKQYGQIQSKDPDILRNLKEVNTAVKKFEDIIKQQRKYL